MQLPNLIPIGPGGKLLAAYDGAMRCHGHVLPSPRGWRGIDQADRELGAFGTMKEAADAISEAAL
jgi:hypothetical protein